MPADIGTGTTITFGTSSFTAQVLAINNTGTSRESIDTSHMGTVGGRTFISGDLFDPGQLDLDIQFLPEARPPYTGAAETVTVTFPTNGTQTVGAKYAALGFVTAFDWSDPMEDLMTASTSIKFSGNISYTAAA